MPLPTPPTQADADADAPTTTTTITRTVVLPLETSQRKNARLAECIETWQEIASHIADVLPSFSPADRREVYNPQLRYIIERSFPDHRLRVHDAVQAARRVVEAYRATEPTAREGHRPQFDGGAYMRLCHCGVRIVENECGYGVKLALEPHNPEWFHLRTGDYQTQVLAAVVDDERDWAAGSAEVRLDDGQATLHLAVQTEVEIYTLDEITRTVGVDLGENTLYAAAVIDEKPLESEQLQGDPVTAVEVEPGREFRHHRQRLDERLDHARQSGNHSRAQEISRERARYTGQVTHTASRRIVDLAAEHAPAAIVLEELTGYREQADDPIHDWPYAQLQEQITYKATEAGLPVGTVDPAGTSQTCRQCGHQAETNRDGLDFRCEACGYKVHADVNAAINIATALD